MKKKLFTLMTLLLCLCSGAWAEDITISPTLSANQTKFSYGLYTITHSSTASSNGSKISSSAITTGTNGDVITINFKTTKSDMYIKSVTFNSLSNGTLSSTDGSISNNVFSVTGNKNDVKVVLTSSSNSVKGSVKVTNVVVNTGNNSVETITFSSVSSGTISFTSKINNVSVTSAISSITTNGNASVSSNELSWPSSKTLVFTSSKNINYIALLDKNDKVYASSGFSASPATYADAAWNGTSKTVTFTNNTGGGRYILKAYVVTEVDAPHTVSFNAGEHGTYTGGDITEESAGAGITLPNLTTLETGYTFNGWYTASTDGTKVGNAGDAYAPSSDTELFAQYSAKTYSITLNANGGTDNGSATATYNSNTLTSITAPTNASYSVQGYYQEAACTNLIADASGNLQAYTAYTDASGNWTHDGNVTLYAKWLTENDAAFANGNYIIGSTLDLSTLFSSSSDGAVTYTVKNANGTGAAIDGTSFTATTAGTATVTATQAATATIAGATLDATITVAVNPLGSHSVTYTLTQGSANVSGSSTSSKLTSFSTAFTKSNLTIGTGSKSGYSGDIKGTNSETEYDNTKYVDLSFTVADGYTFAPSAVTFQANPFNTTSAMKYVLALTDGTTTITSDAISCAKSTDNAVTFASGAFTNKLLVGTVHIRAYFYGAASDKTVYIKSPITITGTVAEVPGPAAPTEEGETVTLTTSNNMAGWRAFNPDGQGYTLDANTTAYIVTSAPTDNKVTLVTLAEANGDIPGNTPVILKTTSSVDSYKMTLTKKAGVADYAGDANKLKVTTASQDLSAGVCRLGYGTTGIGFYAYATASAAAGIIYLDATPAAAEGKGYTLVFESEATGINAIDNGELTIDNDAPMYNLAGQKVTKSYKGVVIQNGKKYINK